MVGAVALNLWCCSTCRKCHEFSKDENYAGYSDILLNINKNNGAFSTFCGCKEQTGFKGECFFATVK